MQLQTKIVGMGAAAILVLAGTMYALYRNNPAPGPNKLPVPVVITLSATADVPLVVGGIGTIEAYNSVVVRPRVDGHIVRINFREGQEVKKGEVLAQLDDRPLRAAAESAAATLERDEITLANARRDLDRIGAFLKNGFVSKQQVDNQSATVDSLAATVAADKATLQNARLQVEYAQIRAPIDGRTGSRIVDEGNLVHSNDAAGLVVINQIHPISADFTLSQDMLPPIRAAMVKHAVVVQVFSRDSADVLGEGELEFIDNQIDKVTGTFRLKARFPNEDEQLWPGQFVNLRVNYGLVEDGVIVPSTAILQNDKGPFVYVVTANNVAEIRPVGTGQADEKTTVVTRGLKRGEQVVADGQSRLKNGATVRIVESSSIQDAVSEAAE